RTASRPGEVADRTQFTGGRASVPRDGQSALAAPVRPRPRAHAGKLRPERRAAHPPGVARLAEQRVRSQRLAHQADAQADDDVYGVSPAFAIGVPLTLSLSPRGRRKGEGGCRQNGRSREGGPGQSAPVADATAAARGRGNSRLDSGCQWPARPTDG